MRLPFLVLLLALASASAAGFTPVQSASDPVTTVDQAGKHSPVQAQRRQIWHLWFGLTQQMPGTTQPAFMNWMGRADTFHPGPVTRTEDRAGGGLHTLFAAPAPFEGANGEDNGASPLIRTVHYNLPAYRHIREKRLHLSSEFERLRTEGPLHPVIPGNRSVPPLPNDAIIVMSAWWPVSGDGFTPMPVWDDKRHRRAGGSNSYINWPRVVAIASHGVEAASVQPKPLVFAGRQIKRPAIVGLDRLYHVSVTSMMVAEMAADEEASKLATLVLGRPLRAGDYLALVGLHVMAAGLGDGAWGTFWWHDAPADGPFAQDRPAHLPAPWANYLMDATFDARLPLETDGSPNICFNPWLDGGLVNTSSENQGQASGVTSNCISCHARASYPAIDILPITRGLPDVGRDLAYQAGQLRTGMVWTIPLNSLASPSPGTR